MKDTDIVHFYKSEEIFEKAQEIFANEKTKLENILPPVDIQHVGSCSIPGAISKFDIDIQIRVSAEQFPEIVEIMKQNYIEKHPQIWHNEFALFKSPESQDIDYIITVIGSRQDDYYRTRDYLIAHPDVLKKYNEIKLSYEGKTYAEYREAKKNFIGPPGDVKFLEY